jgi:6-phosphofructokinase 1
MGRHAGYLTAASIFAKKYPDDGPHMIYVPERPFDTDRFIADVDRAFTKYGRCVAAVSEGVVTKNGEPLVAALYSSIERDAHGNIQLSGTGMLGDYLSSLIRARLNIKRVRSDTFGYLQRSFLGVVSDIDAHEARECGEKAVQYSIWEDVDGCVAIRRTGDYSVEYFLTPLDTVAENTKSMPDDFIDEKNSTITDEFKHYARPLIGQIPAYERISAPTVKKILHKKRSLTSRSREV